MTDTTTTAENALARARVQAANTVHNAVTAVDDAVHHASDRVQDIATDSVDAMREGWHQVSDETQRLSHRTVSYIRHEPVKAVLLAAAAGAAAMALCNLLRAPRRQQAAPVDARR